MLGISVKDGHKFSDDSDVFLLVCSRSGGEFSEYRDEVGGGSDNLVLFADGRERPVGRVQAVRAGDSVPSSRRHKKLEELVVIWHTASGVHLVTVRGKCVAHVGGDVNHALVAKGQHGRSV